MDGARGGGLSKTFRLGEQPIQLGVYAYYNAIRPTAWPRPAVTAVQVDLHLSGSRFHQVSTLSDCPLMSAEGHEQPIDGGPDESAYPPIATVSLHCRK
jgi:hypothetical protein